MFSVIWLPGLESRPSLRISLDIFHVIPTHALWELHKKNLPPSSRNHCLLIHSDKHFANRGLLVRKDKGGITHESNFQSFWRKVHQISPWSTCSILGFPASQVPIYMLVLKNLRSKLQSKVREEVSWDKSLSPNSLLAQLFASRYLVLK